jgi:phosphotransferase system HPr (HPr) family protein
VVRQSSELDHAVARAVLPSDVALHARPAGDLVRAATQLEPTITLAANGKSANARSILEVLALGASGGTELEISASGAGAAHAVECIASLVVGISR